MEPVKHVQIKENMNVNDLVKQMQDSAMGSRRLAEAVDVIEDMLKARKNKGCKVLFGVAGAMVPGGMRRIIAGMLKNGWIDVFVTTGANLTHDLFEALGEKHYKGSANADDKLLNKKGIDRIYDSFLKNESYVKLENFMAVVLEEIDKENRQMNIKEFLWEIGKRIKDKESILRICYKKEIPIFCPAIADSGIGLQVWNHLVKGKKINVSAFTDLKEILDIAWQAKSIGAIIIGGGVPKNYIMQALQFSKAARYAVQITTDRPEPGGSSGAELREAISWGKLDKLSRFIDLRCDATIALPLIYGAVKDRI